MNTRSLFIVFLIILVSFFFIPKAQFSHFPGRKSRIITIETDFPGFFQEAVEQIITNPLEEEMTRLGNLKSIHSFSENEKSLITLTFHEKTNLNEAYQAVSRAVDRASHAFPPSAGIPKIYRSDSESLPVFVFKLDKAKAGFSKESLEKTLQSFKGVGKVEIAGAPAKDVILQVSRGLLIHYGLNTSDIAEVLNRRNMIVSIPFHTGCSASSDLRFGNLQDFEHQIMHNGLSVHNVLEASWQDISRTSLVRVNGQKSIVIRIRMSGDANTILLCRELKNFTESLDSSCILYNQGRIIEESLWKTARAVVTGILAVILVTGLLLKQWGKALAIGFSIPFSILTSMAVLTLLEKEIDLMVLSGFCVGTGLIIDSGIIILECGFIQSRKPVFYSLLSTLLVFSVFVFAPQQIRELFGGMILSISLVLIFSLVYLFLVLPGFISDDRTKQKISFRKFGFAAEYIEKYRFRYPLVLFLLTGVLGIASLKLVYRDQVVLNDDNLTFFIEYPSGTTREFVMTSLEYFEKELIFYDGIEYFTSEYKPERAVFRIKMSKGIKGSESQLRERIVQLNLRSGGNLFFHEIQETRSYTLTLFSSQREILQKKTMELAEILQIQFPDLRVILHFKKRPAQFYLTPLEKGAFLYGITPIQLYRDISDFLNHPVRLKWQPPEAPVPGQYSYDVRILKDDNIIPDKQSLLNLPITDEKGEYRLLKDIVHMEEHIDLGGISHAGGQRSLSLSLEYDEKREGSLYEDVEMVLDSLEWNDQIRINHGRELRETQNDLKAIFVCIILALLLILILLILVFESIGIALYLLLQVPGAIIFPLGILSFFSIPVTTPVVFALIMIIGISVNNGIVLLSGLEGKRITCRLLKAAVESRSSSLLAALITTITGIFPLLITGGGLKDPFGALSFTLGAGLIYSLISLYLSLPFLPYFPKGKKKSP